MIAVFSLVAGLIMAAGSVGVSSVINPSPLRISDPTAHSLQERGASLNGEEAPIVLAEIYGSTGVRWVSLRLQKYYVGSGSPDLLPVGEQHLPRWARQWTDDLYVGGVSQRWLDARGWPCLAAYAVIDDNWPRGVVLRRAWVYRHDQPTEPRYVPMQPILLGFAANVAFYGVLAFLLTAGLGAAVRKRRQWRGNCSQCNYPRSGSKVCSECGAAVV